MPSQFRNTQSTPRYSSQVLSLQNWQDGREKEEETQRHTKRDRERERRHKEGGGTKRKGKFNAYGLRFLPK